MINIVEDLEMISNESDKLELEFNNINIVALHKKFLIKLKSKQKKISQFKV